MNDGRQQFIEKHRAKFWYTPESSKREIGDDLLVETILNDGTLDDFRELRDILTPPPDGTGVFFGDRTKGVQLLS